MKKSAKRKKYKTNKAAFLSVSVIVVVLVAVLCVRCYGLYQKNLEYTAKEEALEEELADETERSEELKEYEEYVGSDEYVIEMARDKLGLVFKSETVFRDEDSE